MCPSTQLCMHQKNQSKRQVKKQNYYCILYLDNTHRKMRELESKKGGLKDSITAMESKLMSFRSSQGFANHPMQSTDQPPSALPYG